MCVFYFRPINDNTESERESEFEQEMNLHHCCGCLPDQETQNEKNAKGEKI